MDCKFKCCKCESNPRKFSTDDKRPKKRSFEYIEDLPPDKRIKLTVLPNILKEELEAYKEIIEV